MIQYEIGDIVIIREWDDMADEFGTTDGDIQCEYVFTHDMRHLCGNAYRIISATKFGNRHVYTLDENEGWSISNDMILGLYEENISGDIEFSFEMLLGVANK